MSLKGPLAGSVPGETYGAGVRRRSKSIAIIWALILVSSILTYGVYALVGSIWATLGVAILCGLVASRADLGFDPPTGEVPSRSDKLIWLILFVPALLFLGAITVYSGQHARDGFDVFKSGLTAGLFGWMLGSTAVILLGEVSRARA